MKIKSFFLGLLLCFSTFKAFPFSLQSTLHQFKQFCSKKLETIRTDIRAMNLGSGLLNNVLPHSLLYGLGLYAAYYHVLNQQALLSRYNVIPTNQETLDTLRTMCQRIGLDFNRLNVVQMDGFRRPPLLQAIFSGGAHVLGTNTIVLSDYSARNPDTLAHELTHIKNKHVPKILLGIFVAPLITELIFYGIKKLYLNEKKIEIIREEETQDTPIKTVIKQVRTLGTYMTVSTLKGLISFVIALKVLHACEHDADIAYAQVLRNTSDLHNGKTMAGKVIPFLNISLNHLWHPPLARR